MGIHFSRARVFSRPVSFCMVLLLLVSCKKNGTDKINPPVPVTGTDSSEIFQTPPPYPYADHSSGAFIIADSVPAWTSPDTQSSVKKWLPFGTRVSLNQDSTFSEPKGWRIVYFGDNDFAYVHAPLICKDCSVSVLLSGSDFYSNNSILVLPAGTITLAQGAGPSLIYTSGPPQKVISGTIPSGASVSRQPNDLAAAFHLRDALRSSDPYERYVLINRLLHNRFASGSVLLILARKVYDDAIAEMNEEGNVAVDEGEEGWYAIRITGQTELLDQHSAQGSALASLTGGTHCRAKGIGPTETVEGYTDTWYEVQCGSQNGWVFGKFVEVPGE